MSKGNKYAPTDIIYECGCTYSGHYPESLCPWHNEPIRVKNGRELKYGMKRSDK